MNTPYYRMFVDENGHQSLKGDLSQDTKRYLCMTGIIMSLREHDEVLTPAMNELKVKYFGSADIVLHRRELISAKPPFEALNQTDVREQFNADFLAIVERVNYRVVSVVIDKYALVANYGILHARDPYALALEYLMQRYQYWLQAANRLRPHSGETRMGDILAEARGGGEDRTTKNTYHEIYFGRGYNALKDAYLYYSSSQIKLKPKKDNVAGLQFTDLLSHPARRYILSTHGLATNLKQSSYEQRIVEVLIRSKFRRNEAGEIDGHGTILFPARRQIK